MEKKFIMAAFSKDRPGVVADITELLYENGCNLEDSSMANIMDEFAILLLFSGRGDGLKDQLTEACQKLEKEKGITAFIRAVETQARENQGSYFRKTITVEGLDQTGIVYKVSRFLVNNNINIESLTSQRRLSPESGTAIYFMNIKVQVPQEVSAESLEEGLSRVGAELHLEITVQ